MIPPIAVLPTTARAAAARGFFIASLAAAPISLPVYFNAKPIIVLINPPNDVPNKTNAVTSAGQVFSNKNPNSLSFFLAYQLSILDFQLYPQLSS